jgi:hypothetical protein
MIIEKEDLDNNENYDENKEEEKHSCKSEGDED